jgi:hypothetical protein
VTLKVSVVVVSTRFGSRDGAHYKYYGWGIFDGMESASKKKFKGFPMFLHSKIFKTALMGDMKLWSSRHRRHRRHRYRRYRRSRSIVEKKRSNAKGKMLGTAKKINKTNKRLR